MKLLICGDRAWKDKVAIEKVVRHFRPTFIIQGGAAGADSLAGEVATERKIPSQQYDADWTTHDKKAGPLRNMDMLEDGKPDIVVGFHNNLMYSKGTKHMLEIAGKARKRVYLYENHQLFEVTYLFGQIPQKKLVHLNHPWQKNRSLVGKHTGPKPLGLIQRK